MVRTSPQTPMLRGRMEMKENLRLNLLWNQKLFVLVTDITKQLKVMTREYMKTQTKTT